MKQQLCLQSLVAVAVHMEHECTQLTETAGDVLKAAASCLRYASDRLGDGFAQHLALDVDPVAAKTVLDGNVEAFQEFIKNLSQCAERLIR